MVPRIVIGIIAIVLTSCLTEDRILVPYQHPTPVEINDGWPTATPSEQGFDEPALRAIYQDLHEGDLWQLRSMLVIRNGTLVTESYFKDPNDVTTRRAIWSCTKQFVGVLAGMAIERGEIANVSEPLGEIFEEVPTQFPDKAPITIQNLLEMRSGIGYSNDGASGQTSQMLRKCPDNSLSFILELPMVDAPGTVSSYTDGNPHLLSLAIQRRTGVPLQEWADTVLFTKLGFRNYDWITYRDGSTMGGYGILTTPREMAKLAQFVLDDGSVDGEQLVSKEWITTMTSPLVDSYSERFRFGYQWWVDTKTGLIGMNGHGGQYAWIDRSTNTIVMFTAEPNTQEDFQFLPEQSLDIVERVLQTVVN